MISIHLTPEGNPSIFIAEQLAERAHQFGATAMVSNREGIDEAIRMATTGGSVADLGGLVIRPFSEIYAFQKPKGYLHIPENGSLEEAMDSERIAYDAIYERADEDMVTIMQLFSRKPTEERLARGLYNAANRQTTDGQTHTSSKNDKWFGDAMGLALGIADDMFGQSWGFPSVGEAADLPYLGGGVAGLVAGRLLLAPALGQLRKNHDMKLIRNNPPIRVQ